MIYALRKNLHFCSADGRLVFLDLERDRYFCLPDGLESAFRRWLGNEPGEQLDRTALAALLNNDILAHTESREVSLSVPVQLPAASLIEGRDVRSNFLNTTSAICERLSCRRLLKRRPLLDVLAPIAARPRQTHRDTASGEAIQEAALAFEASNQWLAAHDRCLERSLALVRYLSRRQLYVQLVLGVTMTPFRAHAWVQHDSLVLNDTLAKVLNYTPILVI